MIPGTPNTAATVPVNKLTGIARTQKTLTTNVLQITRERKTQHETKRKIVLQKTLINN